MRNYYKPAFKSNLEKMFTFLSYKSALNFVENLNLKVCNHYMLLITHASQFKSLSTQ